MSNVAVILKPRRALPFFARHPWVFSSAIRQLEVDGSRTDEKDIAAGSVVRLMSAKGEFIAYGLYNPHSAIRVRLYSWEETMPAGIDLWKQRIDDAASIREHIFSHDSSVNSYRLIFSEADHFSGLIVDKYADWLLVQFTSRALYEHSETIIQQLEERIGPRGIWLRTEKGIRDAESLDVSDGLVQGEPPPRPLFLDENGIRFGIDVIEGQKTGFFLDQRDNRRAVSQYVTGHRVLDVYCYTGGFGITAARLGQPKSVLGIDSSAAAIAAAQANAEMNEVGSICRFEQGDARELMEAFRADERTFDTVIVDPPRMARRRSGIDNALRGYQKINRLAVDLIPSGGLLVSCSCSGLVDRSAFEQMLASVAQQSRRNIQILESRGHPPDHPFSASCPESNYLKCYICRVTGDRAGGQSQFAWKRRHTGLTCRHA